MAMRCGHCIPEGMPERHFNLLTYFSWLSNWSRFSHFGRTYKFMAELTPLVRKGYLDADLAEDWRTRKFTLTDKGRMALTPWVEAMQAEEKNRWEKNDREQIQQQWERKNWFLGLRAGSVEFEVVREALMGYFYITKNHPEIPAEKNHMAEKLWNNFEEAKANLANEPVEEVVC